MRNNGLAPVTKDSNFPYYGCGIYFRGKTISYSSVNLELKATFVRFHHILRMRAIQRKLSSKTFYPNSRAKEHLQEIRETFNRNLKGI